MAVTEESVRTRSVTRHFVTVNGRQVHYRRAGSGPPVILRHESPRSSVALVPTLEALAPRFTAIAIDTAGDGQMFWPWFKRSRGTRLAFDLSSPAVLQRTMQEGILDQLGARPHYSLGYQAGFRYDPLPALRETQVPTVVVAGAGDVLEPHL